MMAMVKSLPTVSISKQTSGPQKFIFSFAEITETQKPDIGERSLLLSRLFQTQTTFGVQVQPGFVIPGTTLSFVLEQTGIGKKVKELLKQKDIHDPTKRKNILAQVRRKIEQLALPKNVSSELQKAYQRLHTKRNSAALVTVRASSLFNVDVSDEQKNTLKNFSAVIKAVLQQWSALYSETAWEKREQQGIDQVSAQMAIIVQVDSSAKFNNYGVVSTIDSKTGGKNIGTVQAFTNISGKTASLVPEEYKLFAPAIRSGKAAVFSHTQNPNSNSVLTQKEAVTLMQSVLKIADSWKQPLTLSWTRPDTKSPFSITDVKIINPLSAAQEIFTLKPTKAEPLLTGRAIGHQIISGKIFCAKKYSANIPSDVILVARNTTPQWESILKTARALIIEEDDEQGHAVLFARGNGIPCIIGALNAGPQLQKEKNVTVVLREGGIGSVFRGTLPFEVTAAPTVEQNSKTKLLVTLSDSRVAARIAALPNDGALFSSSEKDLTAAYGLAAAAFFPRPALIRLPSGAKNELQIVQRLRSEIGLTNIIPILPRCRTPEEATSILKVCEEIGLRSTGPIYGWCDLPANAVLAEDFIELFDGVVIDAEQLTRLTFGLQNSEDAVGATSFKQRAVQVLMRAVITAARKARKPVVMSGLIKQETIEVLDEAVHLKSDMLVTAPDLIRTVRQKILVLEKTIGRTGLRTNRPLLGLFVACGLFAAGLLSLGTGCVAVPTEQTTETISPAELRAQITEALHREELARVSVGTNITVSDFASFTITVPSGWNVEHQANNLLIKNATTTDYIKINRLEKINKNVTSTEDISINNQPAKRSLLFAANSDILIPPTIVYDVTLIDKSILEIQAANTSTESIVNTLIITPRQPTFNLIHH